MTQITPYSDQIAVSLPGMPDNRVRAWMTALWQRVDALDAIQDAQMRVGRKTSQRISTRALTFNSLAKVA